MEEKEYKPNKISKTHIIMDKLREEDKVIILDKPNHIAAINIMDKQLEEQKIKSLPTDTYYL